MEHPRQGDLKGLGLAAVGAGLALGLAPGVAHADAQACYQLGNYVCYWNDTGFPGIPTQIVPLSTPGTAWFLGDFGINNSTESVCNNTGTWVRLWDGLFTGWNACIAPGAGTKDLFIFKNILSYQETAAGVPANCTGTVTTACCSA